MSTTSIGGSGADNDNEVQFWRRRHLLENGDDDDWQAKITHIEPTNMPPLSLSLDIPLPASTRVSVSQFSSLSSSSSCAFSFKCIGVCCW